MKIPWTPLGASCLLKVAAATVFKKEALLSSFRKFLR